MKNIVNMSCMFCFPVNENCSLKDINISSFNIENVTDMHNIFSGYNSFTNSKFI